MLNCAANWYGISLQIYSMCIGDFSNYWPVWNVWNVVWCFIRNKNKHNYMRLVIILVNINSKLDFLVKVHSQHSCYRNKNNSFGDTVSGLTFRIIIINAKRTTLLYVFPFWKKRTFATWCISQLRTDHDNSSPSSISIPEYFITSESYLYYANLLLAPLLKEWSE